MSAVCLASLKLLMPAVRGRLSLVQWWEYVGIQDSKPNILLESDWNELTLDFRMCCLSALRNFMIADCLEPCSFPSRPQSVQTHAPFFDWLLLTLFSHPIIQWAAFQQASSHETRGKVSHICRRRVLEAGRLCWTGCSCSPSAGCRCRSPRTSTTTLFHKFRLCR